MVSLSEWGKPQRQQDKSGLASPTDCPNPKLRSPLLCSTKRNQSSQSQPPARRPHLPATWADVPGTTEPYSARSPPGHTKSKALEMASERGERPSLPAQGPRGMRSSLTDMGQVQTLALNIPGLCFLISEVRAQAGLNSWSMSGPSTNGRSCPLRFPICKTV